MKKSNSAVLKLAAKLGKGTAKAACGATSYFLCYQPKEPEALKKAAKK